MKKYMIFWDEQCFYLVTATQPAKRNIIWNKNQLILVIFTVFMIFYDISCFFQFHCSNLYQLYTVVETRRQRRRAAAQGGRSGCSRRCMGIFQLYWCYINYNNIYIYIACIFGHMQYANLESTSMSYACIWFVYVCICISKWIAIHVDMFIYIDWLIWAVFTLQIAITPVAMVPY